MAAANYYMELAELSADISQRVANSSLPIGCLIMVRDDAPSPQERILSIQWNPPVSLSIKAPSRQRGGRRLGDGDDEPRQPLDLAIENLSGMGSLNGRLLPRYK